MLLTVKNIREIAELAMKHRVRPLKVKSAQQAEEMNKLDSALGLEAHWKKGMKYYNLNPTKGSS